ncbi:hypothetical protein SCNRRL3882_7755 [Streptomyces chartreusis NRRL 3882]|uniref:Uncharacterized protein n=1 Tax=Streptomyces chartreusis NRRL 3882 TaxID=1079985 RepID=A0A2N9BLR6_STRCX|nr:hypothetical protein SCNRRL3882_7755 [Streptomyces chartreusis NRRL 3882]
MAVARFAASGFALVTPALIEWSPSGLYVLLTFFALVSGGIGMLIIRRVQRPSASERQTAKEPAVGSAGRRCRRRGPRGRRWPR